MQVDQLEFKKKLYHIRKRRNKVSNKKIDMVQDIQQLKKTEEYKALSKLRRGRFRRTPKRSRRRRRSTRGAGSLQHTGDEGLPMARVLVAELLQVPLVMLHCPGSGVSPRHRRKCEARPRPTCEREASPLQALAEEVGARHVVEHTPHGDLVPVTPGHHDNDVMCAARAQHEQALRTLSLQASAS